MKKNDNEIIAEFMGMSEKHIEKCDISYDTNWSMLMPVVEKIESTTPSSIQIIGQYCRINKQTSPHFQYEKIESSKIEAVYKAVVEFIKWYNSNPTSS